MGNMMNRTYRPNAYWLRGALPTVEQSKDEYVASVYGAAALAYITIIHATAALDLLEERLPGLYADVRKYTVHITGTKAHMGEARRLELAIGGLLAHSADRAWMADFGNAAYEKVQPHITALQAAVANALGRYAGVPDINACAAVVVAQSLAAEAAEYVRRRAARLRGFTMSTHGGSRVSVPSALASVSCAMVDRCLRGMARQLLEKRLPPDADLAADPSVQTGLKAVLNVMADPGTWAYARDKADMLNKVKEEVNK